MWKHRAYSNSNSSVIKIEIDEFNKMSSTIKLEKFSNNSYMPNSVRCFLHVKKLGFGALIVIDELDDFVDFNDNFAGGEIGKDEMDKDDDKIFEEKIMETFLKIFIFEYLTKNIKEGVISDYNGS